MTTDLASVSLAVQAAAKIVESLKNALRSKPDQEQLSELFGVVVQTQMTAASLNQQNQSLAEEIRTLKAEIAGLEKWAADSARYALREIGMGFAYLLKKDAASGEPAHLLCPNCYAQGKKSFLQHNGEAVFSDQAYKCFPCKTELKAGRKGFPHEIPYA